MKLKILVTAGDGIGPEVTNEAVAVLRDVADLGPDGSRAIVHHPGDAPFPELVVDADWGSDDVGCTVVVARFRRGVDDRAVDESPPSEQPTSSTTATNATADIRAVTRCIDPPPIPRATRPRTPRCCHGRLSSRRVGAPPTMSVASSIHQAAATDTHAGTNTATAVSGTSPNATAPRDTNQPASIATPTSAASTTERVTLNHSWLTPASATKTHNVKKPVSAMTRGDTRRSTESETANTVSPAPAGTAAHEPLSRTPKPTTTKPINVVQPTLATSGDTRARSASDTANLGTTLIPVDRLDADHLASIHPQSPAA